MTRVKLGEVARESKLRDDGRKPLPSVGLEHLDSGDVTLRRWDEGGSNTFTKRFLPGQVLFGRRRAYLQKAAVAPFEGLCSGDIITVEAIPGAIHERLLPFVIQNPSLFDFAVGKSAGSLSPRVKWGKLAEFDFDLPEMAEQQELADILWTAEGVKEHYRSLIKSSDDLVKSQFVEMFGALGSDGSKFNKVRLDSIAQTRLGKMLDKKQQTGEHPAHYLANHNVQWFRFDFDELETMDFTDDDREEFALHDGDLMMCEGGEVGRCAIWHNQLEECYFQKAIHRIRCNTDIVLPEYLAWHFKIAADDGLLVKHTNASTIAHLSGVKLKALQIVLPPIDVQREFVRFSNQVDKSKFALQKSLDDLDAMAKKLMNEELGLGNV